MGLRFLFYISGLYESSINHKQLYGTKSMTLPNPEFYMFYNGTAPLPNQYEILLSDLYINKNPTQSNLELVVHVFNINKTGNEALLNKSIHLHDYAELIAKIRSEQTVNGLPIEKAIDKAINDCIQENILYNFLRKHGGNLVTNNINKT
jgi:hypothetical protein